MSPIQHLREKPCPVLAERAEVASHRNFKIINISVAKRTVGLRVIYLLDMCPDKVDKNMFSFLLRLLVYVVIFADVRDRW